MLLVTLTFIAGLLSPGFLSCAPLVVWTAGLAGGAAGLGRFPSVLRMSPAAGGIVRLLGVVVLWGGLGWLRAVSLRPDPAHHLIGRLSAEPRAVTLHGVVTDDPVELFSPGESEEQVAVVRVLDGRFDGVGWRSTQGLVRARIGGAREALAYGDEVLLNGRLSRVPPPGNPGQFDWRAALARHRIYALMSVKPHEAVVRLHAGQGRWWWRAVYALRHRWERLIDGRFDGARAGLLRSLLLGQRAQLNEGLKQAFVETGTIHLLVISGFNVGLIAWLLELALRLTGAGQRLRLVLCAAGVLGYCLLTGMQPPVLRATIMAWIVLGAVGLDRVIHWPTTVAAAALAILIVDPAQLSDASFQLSFGAVVSLLVFAPPLQVWFATRLAIPSEWFRRYLALGLASTCAVWIGLWPVLAWYFHLVAPVSVVANLLLVPLVSLLVGVGTAILLLGTLAAWLMAWPAWPLARLLDVTVWCVRCCHALPWGHWPVGHPSWGLIAGYYGLLLLTLLRRRARLSAAWLVAAWLAGLNLWMWGRVVVQAAPSPWLEVTVLDVGRGESVFIRTPSRQAILVDAGGRDAGRYDVLPFLRRRGIHALDALILTRLDERHAGGAASLLQEMPVRRLVTSGDSPTTWAGREALRLARARGIPHDHAAAGQRLTGLAGIEMMILSHAHALVLGLSHGRHRVWLGDDAVLVGPAQFPPEEAVISAGGHPPRPSASRVADRLSTKSRLWMTRRDGAVTMRTDGTRLLVQPFRGAASTGVE